jgi:hypothetical protein
MSVKPPKAVEPSKPASSNPPKSLKNIYGADWELSKQWQKIVSNRNIFILTGLNPNVFRTL